MNRFKSLSAFFLLSIVSASAQTLVKETENTDTRFIPGQYMKDGKAAIYFSSDEYGYDDNADFCAHIYDFDLNPLKTFSFQILTPYTVIEKRQPQGIVEKSKTLGYPITAIEWLPGLDDPENRKSSFLSHIYSRNYFYNNFAGAEFEELLSSNCTLNGDTLHIAMPGFRHETGISGHTNNPNVYLTKVDIYLYPSNEYQYIDIYHAEVQSYTGEWEVETSLDSPECNFTTPRCVDVRNMNHWHGGVYLPFSQTFFNDDEKYEYVRPIAELAEGSNIQNVYPGVDLLEALFGITSSDRDGDGEEDYRSTYYDIHYKGYEVADEDGNVLYTFPAPEGCTSKGYIEFYKSDNSILAELGFGWYPDDYQYVHITRFYRIDVNPDITTGTPELIHEERRTINPKPNPAPRGTQIIAGLPEGHGSMRYLTVTSMGGATLMTIPVSSQDTSAEIPTDKLPSGMYLVNLTEDGKTDVSCKIIVK